ncbi:nucleoside hydrolase [Fredinandcohnia humi]
MKKVIIDSDFGIDDAVALFLAIDSEDLDVLGITTIYGNVDVEQATMNGHFLLEFLNASNIPIYRGAGTPLVRERYVSDETHGKYGLGNIVIDKKYEDWHTKTAPSYMIEMAQKYPDEITLITLGPLTNVANALTKNPDAMSQIKEIISMGGGVFKGNMSPVAEFNIWCDPEAAKIVYDSQIPVKMVGLNVTHEVVLTPNDSTFIKLIGGEKGALLSEMLEYYTTFYWNQEQIMGCVMHDPLAVAVASDQSIIDFMHAHVDISLSEVTRGECIVDVLHAWSKPNNSFVGMSVCPETFFDHFYKTLFKDKQREYLDFKSFGQKQIKRG